MGLLWKRDGHRLGVPQGLLGDRLSECFHLPKNQEGGKSNWQVMQSHCSAKALAAEDPSI